MYPVVLSARQLHESISIKFQRALAHKILSNGYQHHTNNLKVNVHKKKKMMVQEYILLIFAAMIWVSKLIRLFK